MDTNQTTIKDEAKRIGLRIVCERTDNNPGMDDSANMDHWRVTLRRAGSRRQLSTIFSKGYGHNGAPPTAVEVLDCLLSDASFAEGYDFADFCANLGYSEDSRKAERTYKACKRIAVRLRAFLGSDFDACANAERL